MCFHINAQDDMTWESYNLWAACTEVIVGNQQQLYSDVEDKVIGIANIDFDLFSIFLMQ